ncbi:MAG: DUF192 domain-containing protein [Flavobacteriaceae bacterium]|nr:DUF192 domain-containing protein [Flavobacteriaceae bacterium]
MKRIVFTLFVGSILFSFTSCKEDKKIIKPIKIEFKKEGVLTFFKSKSDSIITTFDIEIADTDYETQTGLMHRHSMLDNRGMLFVFPEMNLRSFYMKNTYIPLDIIYLDKDKFIVSIQENLKPLDETSLPSQVPAQYVFEINAGLTQQWSLKIGDRMEFIKVN